MQLVKARKQTKKYYPILLKVAPFFLKRFAINPVKHYEPLLNAVEPSNFKIVEPKIKNVLEYYNKQVKNDKDKIELSAVVKKAVKSGSIGQVHVAKTKSGQKKIIKITRPDANKDVLNKYNKYLYVINMNKFGTASDRLYLSAKEADNQIDLMRDEINATVEFENYQKVQKSIDDLNIHSFKTPKVDAATKDGLIMDFVGDKDFANLSATDKDKALKKIGPELIKLMILSPIKNLDYHDGNVRVNSKNGDVFVIDCGRVSDLKAEKHTQLLKLYVLQATNSSSRNFVLNNETLGVVKALLSDGSEKTNLYKSVETLEHKLSEQNPRVYQLSETKEAIEVGSFLHDILSMSSISTTEEKNKTSKKLNTKHQQSKKYFPWFDTSTLLNTWGNYFNLSNENTFLPQLSSKTKNISTSELKDIQAKNLGMLKSYFNSTILTQEEKQIEKEASTKITKKNKTAKLSRKDLKRQAFDDVKQHRAEKLANNFVDELLKTADLTDIKDDDDKYTELKKAVKKSLSEELNTHQAII